MTVYVLVFFQMANDSKAEGGTDKPTSTTQSTDKPTSTTQSDDVSSHSIQLSTSCDGQASKAVDDGQSSTQVVQSTKDLPGDSSTEKSPTNVGKTFI